MRFNVTNFIVSSFDHCSQFNGKIICCYAIFSLKKKLIISLLSDVNILKTEHKKKDIGRIGTEHMPWYIFTDQSIFLQHNGNQM